ncbi:MAG: hypothetical protein C0468_03880 [Planctomyces sp.]|nr:hypothetical protein [Planctomyces sp.]
MAGLLACAMASVAHGQFTASFSGDTTGGLTFNRPVSLTALSVVGTDVAFEAVNFTVSTSGAYSLETLPLGGTLADSFLLLYVGAFDPSAPLANLIAFNDDLGAGFLSLIGSAPLLVGLDYFAVVTGFANSDFGTYDLEIRGPGAITIVPAPGAAALLGLGGALAARRRR